MAENRFDHKKAFWFGIAALLATAGSVALLSGVADTYIDKVWCFAFVIVMVVVALCCAAKTLFPPPGPLSEFTEARAEFLNSQGIAGSIGVPKRSVA